MSTPLYCLMLGTLAVQALADDQTLDQPPASDGTCTMRSGTGSASTCKSHLDASTKQQAKPPSPPVLEQSVSCLNTCPSANDGVCDDGGAGSEFEVCLQCEDCDDCGWRAGCHTTIGVTSYVYANADRTGLRRIPDTNHPSRVFPRYTPPNECTRWWDGLYIIAGCLGKPREVGATLIYRVYLDPACTDQLVFDVSDCDGMAVCPITSGMAFKPNGGYPLWDVLDCGDTRSKRTAKRASSAKAAARAARSESDGGSKGSHLAHGAAHVSPAPQTPPPLKPPKPPSPAMSNGARGGGVWGTSLPPPPIASPPQSPVISQPLASSSPINDNAALNPPPPPPPPTTSPPPTSSPPLPPASPPPSPHTSLPPPPAKPTMGISSPPAHDADAHSDEPQEADARPEAGTHSDEAQQTDADAYACFDAPLIDTSPSPRPRTSRAYTYICICIYIYIYTYIYIYIYIYILSTSVPLPDPEPHGPLETRTCACTCTCVSPYLPTYSLICLPTYSLNGILTYLLTYVSFRGQSSWAAHIYLPTYVSFRGQSSWAARSERVCTVSGFVALL